jgi:hypothetical protein
MAAVVLLLDRRAPELYLIPSTEWARPNTLLVSRDYDGKRSKPEWGINLSQKNLPLLAKFSFQSVATRLKPVEGSTAFS